MIIQIVNTTSKDLKRPQINSIQPAIKKSKLKGGGNIENNDNYLNEILHNNNLYIELAMQIISIDKTVGSNAVQELKEFNSQSLSTQAKTGEQLISMLRPIKKVFD